MILYQWRGQTSNFGDELNGLLWPRLLPDFFDADPSARFLGIGSVLDSRHSGSATKLVAGAGYGGYENPPALDHTWIIHWVRGPRTARMLGLDAGAGLGDPASLLSTLPPLSKSDAAPAPWGSRPTQGVPGGADRGMIGFMPHFESMARGHWAEAARAAGLCLIDPRGDPADIIDAIGRCRMLVSEALHGVIVADAMRVPWIAARPLLPAHRPKWFDWAESLNLRIVFRPLTPSSLLEHAIRLPLAGRRPGRFLLGNHAPRLHATGRPRLIERSAVALRRIAAQPPQLSIWTDLDRCQDRMRERIVALRRAPFRGLAGSQIMACPPAPLRAEDDFAYQPVSTG